MKEPKVEQKKGFTVTDFRGVGRPEPPKPQCRVCGSEEEHSSQYGKPTMACIEFLREEIAVLKKELEKK